MGARGRKSAADKNTQLAAELDAELLAPPKGMPEEERAVWLAAVSSKPPEWFREDSVPMLEAYCQTVVYCRRLRAQAQHADSIMDQVRFQRMLSTQTMLMMQLATKMRLTQQARMGPKKAARMERDAAVTGQPWDE